MRELLFIALVLVCPLMMIWMMRGHGGHASHIGGRHDHGDASSELRSAAELRRQRDELDRLIEEREVADRVLWLEDGRFKELLGLKRDPVCGMLVEPERAVTLEQAGETLFFCAAGCRDEYAREHPETLAAREEDTR